MSRNKSARRKKPAASSGTTAASRRRGISPRRLVRGLLIALAILAVPVAWFAMEARQARAVADLSVIGSGEPVVVQVHEPGCTGCERLLEQVNEARDRLDERLALRRVNIATSGGRRFADEHGVSQVTLVLFDARGSVVDIKRGVIDADELETAFVELQGLPRPRRR